jgi:predicted O-methyltransferase YrrM
VPTGCGYAPQVDLRRIKRVLRGELPPVPLTGAADARWSVVSSAVDLYTRANDQILNVLVAAVEQATSRTLDELESRCTDPDDAAYIRCWPGEHYRLLAGLVAATHPMTVIEIGTFKGQGALALLAGSPTVRVVTYDITPWTDFPDTALRETDFVRIEQRIGDLGEPGYLESQLDTLRSADVIFVDGPKDGVWELKAVPMILRELTDRQRLVVFDDIHLLAMV